MSNAQNNNINEAILESLDLYEEREVKRMMGNGMTLEKALQILINSVEGDDSQLSRGLLTYKLTRGIL